MWLDKLVLGHCWGLPTWQRNLDINSKFLSLFSSCGQGLGLNCEICQCFLSLTWHPGSIRRASGSVFCICLSNIWLLAEKIHVSDQQGSFRYSSRSPSWNIHGVRLKSMLWSTLVLLHNATWLPKFLQMCLNIITKISMTLSYCYFNPGKKLASYPVPQNRVLWTLRFPHSIFMGWHDSKRCKEDVFIHHPFDK